MVLKRCAKFSWCVVWAFAVVAGSTARPAISATAGAANTLDKPQTQIAFAQRLEVRGDNRQALELYQAVLSREPDNLGALEGAARTLSALGLHVAALAPLAKLEQLQPKAGGPPLQHAILLNRLVKPDSALQRLELAEQRGAPKALLESERGLALDLLGRNEEARLAYTRALSADPSQADTVLRLALSLAIMQDFGAALTLLQTVANNPGGLEPVRRTLALVYALSGETDEAVRIAATALPEQTAKALRPFYARLSTLTPQEKAAAVHLNHLPAGQHFEVAPASARQGAAESQSFIEIQTPPPTRELLAKGDSPRAATGPDVPLQPIPQKPRPADKPCASKEAGLRFVQIGSVLSPDQARTQWRTLAAKAGAATQDSVPYIESAAGGRYRILLGVFSTAEQVSACRAALSTAGIDSLARRDVGAAQRLR